MVGRTPGMLCVCKSQRDSQQCQCYRIRLDLLHRKPLTIDERSVVCFEVHAGTSQTFLSIFAMSFISLEQREVL